MKTDSKGRIIADIGITWLRHNKEYYSVDPSGYYIERTQTYPLWRLCHKAPYVYNQTVADQVIFFSYRVIDCMRVAEIFDISKSDYNGKPPFVRSLGDQNSRLMEMYRDGKI